MIPRLILTWILVWLLRLTLVLIFTLILVLTFDSEINVDSGSKIMNDLDIDIEDGESLMGMWRSM